jgi:hydrogenase maturation protease
MLDGYSGCSGKSKTAENRRSGVRIAVVAFGHSSGGDGGIGLQVISRIDRGGLKEDVAIIDGGKDVLKTLESMSGFDGLVIVDAALMGEAPGTVRSFSLNELILNERTDAIVLYGLHMDEELLFGRKYLNLPPTTIVAIEPEKVEGPDLSQSVQSRMDRYTSAVTEAVNRFST